jgi:hypothetical protein
MSRTRRNKIISYFRSVKTKNAQTAEYYAAKELYEEGFTTPPRQQARSSKKSGKIPSSYDDVNVAAWHEVAWKRRKKIYIY